MSIHHNHPARISRFVFICILLLAMMGLQPVRSVHAATAWYVATTGSDANSCSTPASPCATMNSAIQRAAIGDTIYVAAGTYTGSGNEVVYIDRGVTLTGGWNAAFTARTGFSIVDGEGLRRGITAIFNQTGTLEWFLITNGNYVDGGGLYNRGNELILNHVAIHHNKAVMGGGIRNEWGLHLNNVTISENTASTRGGGIYNGYSTSLSLNNVTISNNIATQFNAYGGGIDTEIPFTIRNTIISGNSAAYGPDCFLLDTIISGGHNVIGDTTMCSITAASGDQLNVNPQLGTFLPVQGYHPLLPASPAIDAGDAATCQVNDQRGLSRVGTCDIGAYEYHAPGSAVQLSPVRGDRQIVAPGATFRQPLQVVALDAQGNPVSGVDVTFTAPYTGVLIFTNSQTYELNVTTDESGIASSGGMVASDGNGSYVVTASTPGIPAVEFHLENTFWYVRPDGNNANECKLIGSACATINGALAKAQPGNTILVAAGTYTGTGSGNGTQTVLINKDIVIEGGWDPYFSTQDGKTVIDGQNARRGITLWEGYEAVLTNISIVHGNDGQYGGGVYNEGRMTLRNSTISDNFAFEGGGIRTAGSLTLEDVGVFNNTATHGGGIIVDWGTAALKNVTVSGNTATYTGGLLVTGGTGVALNNVTISDNTSEYYSAGIDQSYSGPISIGNSIVAGNSSTNSTADDCAGDIASNGHNLIQNVTGCSVTPKDGDQFNVDPQLDAFDLAVGVQPLLPNSPAIDAGNDATCEGTDQRGVIRPQGGHCDMGAYEYDPPINYVKWDAQGKNNGASWTDAFTDLQSAIAAASSGDQIWVAAGTYKPSSGAGRSASFALKNGVPIYGGFAGTETSLFERNFETNVTILSGEIGTEGDNSNNSYHVVTANGNDSTAVLDGFTITGGNANGSYPNDIGGGMLTEAGSPTLVNLIFSQNAAGGGGGMYSSMGSPSLMNVLFIENTSTSGGGGMGTTNSNAYLFNVIFAGNSSNNGGGMINDNSSPQLEKVTFIHNAASGYGGGMSNAASNSSLIDVVFENNTAGYGGGMSSSGDPALSGVLFKGNTAQAYGGGMENLYGNPVLTNVTFAGNSSDDGGGAISHGYGSFTLNHVTMFGNTSHSGGGAIHTSGNNNLVSQSVVTNSIIWGNTSIDGEIVNQNGGYTTVSYSIVQGGYSGTGNSNVDPQLAPLGENGGFTETIALQPGSPAINAANDANCPTSDQRGVGRPQGPHCDRGAYEFVPVSPVTLTVTKTADTNDGICNADCSLREALVNSYSGDTIQFAVNGTIVLTSDLPVINKTILVDGKGKTVKLDGNKKYRIFTINETGDLTLRNLTLQNGQPTSCTLDIDQPCGGAIYNNGSLSVINVTFSGNYAGLGGAIFIDLGTTQIESSTFTGNSATKVGGGIFNWIGTLDVINSTFYGNSAAWDGGAIYNDISSLILQNNTFSNNSAERGGAVYNSAGDLAFANNILANSTAGDDCFNESPYASISLNINNLIETNAAAPNNCGLPFLTADPRLAPLASNGGLTQTMALLKESPAIDAGSDADCPAADQRGVARPYGAHCDIGAYEQNGSFLPVTPTFADVPLTHPYWQDIETLYAYGLTGGCANNPLRYCPDQIMNRGAAAVFMLRGNFGPSYVPPVPAHIFKDDWTKGPWAEPWAEGMKLEGLSAGCLTNPLKYCPWDQIPREQAVIFALRMKYGKDYKPPAATGTVFADMTNPSYYATAWAEQAYKDGIIKECGASGGKPLFCPKNMVSRGLAAYMIVRAKNLTMP